MSKILVTGANGFVGQHMVLDLCNEGHEIMAVGREDKAHDNIKRYINSYHKVDLANPVDTNMLPLGTLDAVIHLAGIPTTTNTPEEAARVLQVNVDVHRVLYQAMLDAHSRARTICVSTGLVYDQNFDVPFTEDSPIQPDNEKTNPYVLSKIRAEGYAAEYREKGLDIIIARPFNHTGPRQTPGLFVPDKADQIAKAKAEGVHLDFGAMLDFWRDFTDVRDVTRAYRLLATIERANLKHDIYNICSGEAVYGQDIFIELAGAMEFTDYSAGLHRDNSEAPKVVGSHERLTQDTLWVPQIIFPQTIVDFVKAR